jgi:excisionase family DNA binding protein
MTPDEVASALRISKKGVYRLAAAGVLASVRVGGLLRFQPGDLQSYIERATVAATAIEARRPAAGPPQAADESDAGVGEARPERS